MSGEYTIAVRKGQPLTVINEFPIGDDVIAMADRLTAAEQARHDIEQGRDGLTYRTHSFLNGSIGMPKSALADIKNIEKLTRELAYLGGIAPVRAPYSEGNGEDEISLMEAQQVRNILTINILAVSISVLLQPKNYSPACVEKAKTLAVHGINSVMVGRIDESFVNISQNAASEEFNRITIIGEAANMIGEIIQTQGMDGYAPVEQVPMLTTAVAVRYNGLQNPAWFLQGFDAWAGENVERRDWLLSAQGKPGAIADGQLLKAIAGEIEARTNLDAELVIMRRQIVKREALPEGVEPKLLRS